MTTSKSPLAVARVAYAVARESLPLYSHKRSPHRFTLSQLAACLTLKEFFTTDYRGITEIIADSSDIRKALELTETPHFTTLQKASRRLTSKKTIEQLLKHILTLATKAKISKKSVALAAMDGTGFESHYTSRYFTARRTQGMKSEPKSILYARFPKVGIVSDTANHLILSGVPDRGPRFDIVHFNPALRSAVAKKHIYRIVADRGYDSEANHVRSRTTYGTYAIIPATDRRWKSRIPKGKYRKLMRTHFPKKLYGQRWQVETVISMLKRNFGSFLRARNYWSQCREILLRLFAHNVLIVLPIY